MFTRGEHRSRIGPDRISQKVKTEDRTECGRSGPVVPSVGPVQQGKIIGLWSGPMTELAKKPRPRTGPNVVGPVCSGRLLSPNVHNRHRTFLPCVPIYIYPATDLEVMSLETFNFKKCWLCLIHIDPYQQYMQMVLCDAMMHGGKAIFLFGISLAIFSLWNFISVKISKYRAMRRR